MPETAPTERFIVLPERGLKIPSTHRSHGLMVGAASASRADGRTVDFFAPESRTAPLDPAVRLEVIDSIHEDGPKLVEGTPAAVEELRRRGLRREPLRNYRVGVLGLFNPKPPAGAPSGTSVIFVVVSRATGQPVPGALVTAFLTFGSRRGAEGVTGANGEVSLDLGAAAVTLDRLYVHPPLAGFWGHFAQGVAVSGVHRVPLEDVVPGQAGGVAYFYPAPLPNDGQGVRVGVIDTGIDNTHPALVHVIDGTNTAGERRDLWQDNGTGHGTHVAGIVGARGVQSGLAPAADLRSYRAFAQDKLETSNYEILKAVIYALDEGCHVLNLSLTGEERADETLRRALVDAHERGVLAVVAAGNAGRSQVGYPAAYAYQEGLCVGALGRVGTFPAGSLEEADVSTRRDPADAKNFVAQFSNRGDVSVIAPGVGIVSTVPGGYGVMSGTSMASPVVAGLAARLLSRDLLSPSAGSGAVLGLPADSQRTLAMISLVQQRARKLFGDPSSEGSGLPSP